MGSLRVPTCLLLALAALAAPAQQSNIPDAAATPKASTSGGITEIVLERTWCYGSCPVDQLVLRADGTADYTGMENTPRTGRFTGKFWTGDFDQLAQWLVTQGFFELKDAYGSLNVDTPSDVIRVTRGGERKSAINHSLGHSLQVWGMGNNIRAVAADIAWQPALSGIRGEARPDARISVYPEKQGYAPSGMKEAFAVRADQSGRFEVPLAAGSYGISSSTTRDIAQTVVVEQNRFSEIVVRPAAVVPRDPASPGMSAVPPGEGLYVHALLTPAKYIYRKGTGMFLLGDKWEPVILEKQLWSDSKDNSTFLLGLTIPWDAAVSPVSHYLIIGEQVFQPNGSGSRGREISRLFFRIPDAASAAQVAKFFDTPIRNFRDPGYQLRVTLTPTRAAFKRGEMVAATLRIANTGANAVEFAGIPAVEGRHDYYTLTAQRNGQPVTDISFRGKRGGNKYPYTILPGTSFEETVNLGEWFEFRETGAYAIHGAYQLHLRDTKSGAGLPIEWTEPATTDLVVEIE